METISATELRDDWDAVLDRVEDGERFVVTRDGEPVAVLVRPSVLLGVAESAESDEADERDGAGPTSHEERVAPGAPSRQERESSALEELRDDWESRH